jgi:DNA repair protein RecO (recombination protein O)
MHHIYHTEGIILESRNYREADKYYLIFTKDFGLIYASAQSVRKLSSKLRFVLQDYTYVKIDLVRGKDFWRITSASKTNKLDNLLKDKEVFQIFINISRLLRRLLAGEEPNEILFNNFLKGLLILEKTKNKKELGNIEALIVLRILNNLGYIGQNDALDTLISSPFEDIVLEIGQHRIKILKEINRALKETQL